MRSSCMTVRVPAPPGTTRTSASAASANDFSTAIDSMRVSARITPGSAATKSTRAPGRRLSTSYGPTASSAVNRSNSGIAICIDVSSCLEPLAILGRAHAEPAVEGAAHRLDRAEAARARNDVDLLAGGLEPQAGVVHAQRLDVGRRRHSELATKCAREVARAHVRQLCEALDGQLLAEVAGEPGLQLTQGLAVGHLRSEMRAELRLAAGAACVDHEPARGLERDLAAEVLVDERQCQVHSGRDPRRGPDVAVAHVDGVGVDLDAREQIGELAGVGPVRGGAAAVEQACRGKDERAAADRGDAP